MIENLIHSISLSFNLTVTILAFFLLMKSVRDNDFKETIFWLVVLFVNIFITINNPMFSWSIYNFMQEGED